MRTYGRDEETWERLTEIGLDFLIERARAGRATTYSELNAALVERTGHPGFDFRNPEERAAMGHLLGEIVLRNHRDTGLMISALVCYLGANDAGAGFYRLAAELGLLAPRAPEDAKTAFWVGQLNALYQRYAPGQG